MFSKPTKSSKGNHFFLRLKMMTDWPVMALISLCLGGGVSAFAASFSCNQVVRAQEKFICQYEEISRLDELMTGAYREQMKFLPKEAQLLVQSSQRSWLNFWPMACSSTPGVIKFDANSKECVAEAYRSRTSELSGSVALAGRVTYKIGDYRYLKPKIKDDAPSTHTISFPQVVAKSLNDVALNGWLARDLSKWQSSLDTDSNTELSINVKSLNNNLLHATEVQYFFGHGAAHPLTNKANHYFILNSGRAMNAIDFFAKNGWDIALAEFTYKKLQHKLGDNLQVKTAKELIPLIREPSNWSVSTNTFSLEFNPYEVAPYSEGFVEVNVPFSILRLFLTPLGRSTLNAK